MVARKRSHLGLDPKGVSPNQRVKEFPTEPLTVSHGQLFCSACREQLSLKRSILKSHVESVKHRNAKERLARKDARELDIASSLRKYNEQVHPRGETLLPKESFHYLNLVLEINRTTLLRNRHSCYNTIRDNFLCGNNGIN